MEVTTHQRSDLRWIYRIDGKDSEKTYPTAGEAERGAAAAVKNSRPKREGWQWWLILAIASLPVWWLLIFIVRMLTGR